MMSLEEYKRLNYKMVVQYNVKEKAYFVEFPDLPGCMADAETATEAVENALKAKDEWLEVAVESGYEIPAPVERPETTGRQTVRMPKSLHAQVIERAEQEGVSQNQLILTFIAEGLRRAEGRDLSGKMIEKCDQIISKLNEKKTEPSVINALVSRSFEVFRQECVVPPEINANFAFSSAPVSSGSAATASSANAFPLLPYRPLTDVPAAGVVDLNEERQRRSTWLQS